MSGSAASGRRIPTQPFKFLALPRELRDEIYRYLLLLPRRIIFDRQYSLVEANWAGWFRSKDNSKPPNWICHEGGNRITPHASLLGACHQTFDEAAQVLYGTNGFVIPLCRRELGFFAQYLSTYVVTAPYFKSIELSLGNGYSYITFGCFTQSCSEANTFLPKFTGLEEITINVGCKISDFDVDLFVPLLAELSRNIPTVRSIKVSYVEMGEEYPWDKQSRATWQKSLGNEWVLQAES